MGNTAPYYIFLKFDSYISSINYRNCKTFLVSKKKLVCNNHSISITRSYTYFNLYAVHFFFTFIKGGLFFAIRRAITKKIKASFFKTFLEHFQLVVIEAIGIDLNYNNLGYQIWAFTNFPIMNE